MKTKAVDTFDRDQEHALMSRRVVDCPYCASVLCGRVLRHGSADFLGRLCGLYPWYCKVCSSRFYVWKRNYRAKASKTRLYIDQETT